ncbi:tetratricopeptide repeat protein [Rubellimicrobium arenae]|uniref:tetratricopeptide repeat protein n=1 Tax=Rubellimicrobium arenae TaxID=2817372 RepID=UPI001B30F000|nr:tetratricopeptide repeat protein [Rubellimicrobium arenae]
MIRSSVLFAAALSSTLLLTACESREEKAERYYQSALTLLEQGDEDRALVELRNVFEYDGFHKEARMAYADLQLKRGNVAEAYRHYLRLIEQYPDTAEVRLTLAEIAIEQGNWDEARRHGQEAVRLLPDDPRAQAIDLALRYQAAVEGSDSDQEEEIARQARILLASHEDLEVARRIVIHRLMTGPNPTDALPELDRAIAAEPGSLEFNMAKFQLLANSGDMAATGAQLQSMYKQFPDNEEVRTALVRWYIVQGDTDGAETLLRELAGDEKGSTDGFVTLVQFLESARGSDAARQELDKLITANEGTPNADLYRTLRASLDFQEGRQDEAIAAIEDVLGKAEPSDQTRDIKTTLARMLSATGNLTGARQRVEEVLTEDATNVDALKLRAAWAVSEDRPGDAIVDLRTALSQNSRDIEILTLMAEAYERDGNLDLAAERLAAAVDVSNSAAEPSLRYADLLIRQNKPAVAESVLTDARRANPGSVDVALRLGQLWLEGNQPDRVQPLIDQLDQIDSPQAKDAAQRLRAGVLFAQDRTEDGLAMLRSLADAGGDSSDVARAVAAMVRNGSQAEARDYLDGQLAKSPDSTDLRLLDASLRASAGEMDAAEATLRDIVGKEPGNDKAVQQLYSLLIATRRGPEAEAALDAGLAAQPESGSLRWIKAALLEQKGDISGAIEIYQALYDQDTFNVLLANNLASLLSQRAASSEDLDRAFAIARRLRGSNEPALQDTYGWILSQRGEHEEALTYLQPAAEALSNDPTVQFHLGMTLEALGRTDDARTALARSVEIGSTRPFPQLDTAQAALAKLGSGGESPADGNSTDEGQAPSPAPAGDAGAAGQTAPAQTDAAPAPATGTP